MGAAIARPSDSADGAQNFSGLPLGIVKQTVRGRSNPSHAQLPQAGFSPAR
jgi:hypothetical protein